MKRVTVKRVCLQQQIKTKWKIMWRGTVQIRWAFAEKETSLPIMGSPDERPKFG